MWMAAKRGWSRTRTRNVFRESRFFTIRNCKNKIKVRVSSKIVYSRKCFQKFKTSEKNMESNRIDSKIPNIGTPTVATAFCGCNLCLELDFETIRVFDEFAK